MRRPAEMEIRRTRVYENWWSSLRDRKTQSRIADRINRLTAGNPGNFRSVGGGVLELKLDFGPGYRIYYVQKADVVILLLCGGDKSTQSKDIDLAKALATELN